MKHSSLAVLALVLAVLGLRLSGLDYSAPYWVESDAYTALHAGELRADRGSNPRAANDTHYPHLIAQLAHRLPAVERPDASDPVYQGQPERLRAAHLAAAGQSFFHVRLVVALLSLLAIPGTWFLARRFLCRRWSLFAVALCSTSLLFQCFAQQARPHAAAAALMLVSVLCALRLRRRPSLVNYTLAGLTAALAFACLHSGVAVLLPLAAAYLIRALPSGTSPLRRVVDGRALILLALVLLAVPLFYPFFLDATQMAAAEGLDVSEEAVGFTHHNVAFDAFNGAGFATVLRTLWTWEPALGLLVALALLVWLATLGRRAQLGEVGPEERGDQLVVLSFCLPYLFVIGLYAETYERFLLPLVPFLAVFAALGLARLSRAPAWRRPVAAVAVSALLVSGWSAGHLAWLRTRPDTLELTSSWLEQHADRASDSVFLFPPPLDLPLGRDAASLGVRGNRPTVLFNTWSRYQARLDGGGPAPQWSLRWIVGHPSLRGSRDPELVASFLDEQGPGLFVVQVMTARAPRFVSLMRAELARRGERVARFGPDPDPDSCDYPLFDQDELVPDWPNVFARLWRARALGPVVEVYRVD